MAVHVDDCIYGIWMSGVSFDVVDFGTGVWKAVW